MSNLKLEFNYSIIQDRRGYTGRGAMVRVKRVTGGRGKREGETGYTKGERG
jgi:hypothetical protein